MKYVLLLFLVIFAAFWGYHTYKSDSDNLVLKKRGSFYIGGENVAQNFSV